MMNKEDWINDWLESNERRPKETDAEFEARAEHAWTTHNEDPGAGIITGDAARSKPDTSFDEENPNGLSDEELGIADFATSRAEGMEPSEKPFDPHAVPEGYQIIPVTNSFTGAFTFWPPGVEGGTKFGLFPGHAAAANAARVHNRWPPAAKPDQEMPVGDPGPIPEAAVEHVPFQQDGFAQLVDVAGAPGYRVGRRHYDAEWYFFRPGQIAPEGPYPRAGLAMAAAGADYDEARLAGERPIGRTVGTGTPEETRAKKARTEKHVRLERVIARAERRPSAPVVDLKETVILESPYAGDVERNVEYARRAMADCLRRGEAPFASHLLYTQIGVLDDSNPAERKRGIEAGFMIGKHVKKAVFYVDHGLSPGMHDALVRFVNAGKTIEFRYLDGDDSDL